MRVLRADSMGLCFGVRDALDYIRRVPDPAAVTIYGELVHNERINTELVQLGFRQVSEQARGTREAATPEVLVTAHGISNAERGRLAAAGRVLHDTTCPLVRRAHEAALRLDAEGRFVIVVGRRGHVEVLGLTGDLRACEVVESPAEVRAYPTDRIGVICQTTTPDALAEAVLEAVHQHNPHAAIRFIDTVCRPTRERQEALLALLPRVQALVVVGGRNSRNSRELAETARRRGVPAFLVQGAEDMPAEVFEFDVVGLTAGTSTPDDTIDEVESLLTKSPQRHDDTTLLRCDVVSSW